MAMPVMLLVVSLDLAALATELYIYNYYPYHLGRAMESGGKRA